MTCRLQGSDVMLCHDGTLEGFLSLVFQAYAWHIRPAAICCKDLAQPSLGQEVREVAANQDHAERVKVGICNQGGCKAYDRVKKAFLSDEPGSCLDAFDYVAQVMAQGRRAAGDIANPVVARVEKLSRMVEHECEYVRQFVRFQELESGIFLAVIEPKCSVLPLVMNHFASRFNTQPFVIYDKAHGLAAAYDTKRCFLVRDDQVEIPHKAAGEDQYQQLWKTFYDAISHEQRYNPGLRTRHMPQRFWKNLSEMALAAS